jgi:hypothetical protein
VNNPGFAFTALAVRIGIAPALVSYVQIGLTMDMTITNPTLPDFAVSTTPIVVATDGTLGALPDFVLADASLVVPLGVIGGIEFFDVFAVSIVPGLTVEDLGTMSALLTFTGIVDPAVFSLIEFPQSLLDSMLPGGPALFAAFVGEVPEPATLALLGAMLLLLAWRSRRAA